jgi:hypothetical protein
MEDLKKKKVIEMGRIGTAHLEAEAAKKRAEIDRIELKEKQIRDVQFRRVRGAEAIMKERQLQKEKQALEEEI